MSSEKPIHLSKDLLAYAEERVRTGKAASVSAVVHDAVAKQKLAALREAIEVGIAEIDAGEFEETTPDKLVAEASRDIGLP